MTPSGKDHVSGPCKHSTLSSRSTTQESKKTQAAMNNTVEAMEPQIDTLKQRTVIKITSERLYKGQSDKVAGPFIQMFHWFTKPHNQQKPLL